MYAPRFSLKQMPALALHGTQAGAGLPPSAEPVDAASMSPADAATATSSAISGACTRFMVCLCLRGGGDSTQHTDGEIELRAAIAQRAARELGRAGAAHLS